MSERLTLLHGDALAELRKLPAESVQCCVTSPPYWGLRDYGHPGQLGLEATPALYVAAMVAVFEEVRRVLRSDGTCWVNLGDSYATGAGAVGNCPGGGKQGENRKGATTSPNRMPIAGLKPKDLCGIPWRVAFALQSAGWYLRSDIIWHKPNPMPESVTDRPTKAHEYLFLLTKSERYYYDAEAIKEKVTGGANPRRGYKTPDGWDTSSGDGGHGSFHKNGREKGKANGPTSRMVRERTPLGLTNKPNPSRSNIRPDGVTPKSAPAGSGIKANDSFQEAVCDLVEKRNKRTVWTVATAPYSDAHFATYPPALITPCILAGTKPGDVVLDPFGGSGTTGEVALSLGRRAILIELNPEYLPLIERRTNVTPGLAL